MQAWVGGGEAAGGVEVDEGEPAGGDEGVVIGGEVADLVAVELEAAVGEFAGSGEVAGVGEGWGYGAIGVKGGVPAAVVEVEVGVDDVGDFFGLDTGGC